MSETTDPRKTGRPPAVYLMRRLGLEPDPWQAEVLEGDYPRLLLNCSRQAGKSTTVALLALAEAIFVPHTLALLLSRSHRQSKELFRMVTGFFRRLDSPMVERQTLEELQLANHSRIVSLPCKEETIRGYPNVTLMIIDEAARVPDELYQAVSPMLAVSAGRMICLSTPHGKRGFFYESWSKGSDWHRIEVPAERIKRIKREVVERQRVDMGESWYRQEYCCSFEALEGLVYPDFARCVVPGPAPEGDRVGGIDFGVRNPFAAVWGVLDRDRVLWLTGEHYSREKSLAYHAQHLPRDVTWYGDPSGAREILELRCANIPVRRGDNAEQPGISAVRARLENGTLKVVAGCCPNLLAEAGMYRYDPDPNNRTEKPVKEYDHAMDALRYLVSKIDARKMACMRKGTPPDEPPPEAPTQTGAPPAPGASPPSSPPAPPKKRKWLSIYNEELWTRLWP
jgi:Helicase